MKIKIARITKGFWAQRENNIDGGLIFSGVASCVIFKQLARGISIFHFMRGFLWGRNGRSKKCCEKGW